MCALSTATSPPRHSNRNFNFSIPRTANWIAQWEDALLDSDKKITRLAESIWEATSFRSSCFCKVFFLYPFFTHWQVCSVFDDG